MINHNLKGEIQIAINNLNEKLAKLNLFELGISEYNIRYLSSKLSNPSSNFGLYSDLLYLCFDKQDKSLLSSMTLVDYGGGSGLFSMLAKSLGIGTVIYNDIYDVSCRDVKIIADAIGYPIDGIVCGEIDDVIYYLKENKLKVDSMCSFDVIEHIYDINDYLRKCNEIPRSEFGLRLVFGSGAIGNNPFINHKLRRKHLISENVDREKKFGHKERDTLKSFVTIRKEIIRNYSEALKKDIPEETVNKLAINTRGLRKEDIEIEVKRYIEHNEITVQPKDKTNTCDPLTGNWDEHIMDPKELALVLNESGFHVKILPGYWRGSNRVHIRLIKFILNSFIRNSGQLGFLLSPYYVIVANKTSE
jgi:hypothetical protein